MAQGGQGQGNGRALGVAFSRPTLDGLTVGQSGSGVSIIDLGYDAADKVGFYGTTPVVQRATAASHTTIVTTVAVSTTTGAITSWGFSTSSQANSLTAAVAEIQATLVALGLWAA